MQHLIILSENEYQQFKAWDLKRVEAMTVTNTVTGEKSVGTPIGEESVYSHMSKVYSILNAISTHSFSPNTKLQLLVEFKNDLGQGDINTNHFGILQTWYHKLIISKLK